VHCNTFDPSNVVHALLPPLPPTVPTIEEKIELLQFVTALVL
jgi:hypothetical protein